MIALSKLLCDGSFAHDGLRYGRQANAGVKDAHQTASAASERKPVVVWNMTRMCNLRCIHCYTESEAKHYPGEMTVPQAKVMLDDLADYGIPALLMSGGEPLTHPNFWELAGYARDLGLRCVLSTNATLITEEAAGRLKDLGMTYIGASLDGMGSVDDFFRGKEGAFEKAVAGIRNCKKAGLKISLRMTMTKHNTDDLDGIFDFVEQEGIERVCFYHLAYAGRGADLAGDDLNTAASRDAVDRIIDRTERLAEQGGMWTSLR
jgi:MoaA/NifB/PqqE/SkfB family radical SAM enzyme